ncbi:hypothetical protein DAEQUDRAFT_767243 [Daedalea quercina L-15889]|uniref:Cora-domain-containing protein n=1 Tax=Daedalea quercina L-15889 TaxID=1314783 RepID=A0A165NSY6_9APHY|nr:hypothetical protein DAEQUDRAFT_767243 [Daedalea quercina L-15889]
MPSSSTSGSSEDISAAPELQDKPQSSSDVLKHSLSVQTEEVKSRLPTIEIAAPKSPMKLLQSPIANLRSPTRSSAATQPLPPGAYKQRFRATVHRVMAMRRASMLMSSGRIGAEPGIDPRRASANAHYGHIRQQCVVEIVDYSVTKCSVGRMTNRQLVEILGSPQAAKREPWARVRWINVGGISWDVLSALAIKYGYNAPADMHPLAIEDVIHQHGNNARSKADYYPQHLFLRILCHRLASEDDQSADEVPDDTENMELDGIPRSESPGPMEESDYEQKTWKEKRPNPSRYPTSRFGSTNRATTEDLEMVPGQQARATLMSSQPFKKNHTRDWKILQKLKFENEDRVNVKISPVCIFLFRDGTVISISKETNLDFMAPIRERLRQFDTGLRKSADPSLLVQSLIDLIVDQALEVVEEYQVKILKLEQDVLMRPKMKTVTALHMLQGDLNMHKRTLEPIKTLVYSLRRYDADRAAVIMANEGKVWEAVTKPVGYMSEKSKTYLADVHDHMEYILMSLDMFAGVSDNLINYTCNMVSYQMNEGMRKLTLVTIIFLPLTFLSGYFGMNFTKFWAVYDDNHSDLLFWEIAIPIMMVVAPLFLWPDFMRLGQYIQKRFIRRSITKSFKTKVQ